MQESKWNDIEQTTSPETTVTVHSIFKNPNLNPNASSFHLRKNHHVD